MTEKEYEAAINNARQIILSDIEMLDIVFEEIKEDWVQEKRVKMVESFLQLLLLIAHTEQGKCLFIKTLELSKEVDLEITHKYWNIYDDIENLVKNRFFNIVKE